MTLEIFDREDQRDSFIRLEHAFSKDGYTYHTKISYIPDKYWVSRLSLSNLLKEYLRDGENDSRLNQEAQQLFTQFIKEVDPNFSEMSIIVSDAIPFNHDLEDTEKLSSTVYLSAGKGDWENYATLRLSQF